MLQNYIHHSIAKPRNYKGINSSEKSERSTRVKDKNQNSTSVRGGNQ